MKRLIIGALCALTASGAWASDFFSTEESEDLFDFGLRIGVNTSNRTVKSSALPGVYHHESWGTGFDLGAVVNLNFRDYLTLQPGFFFESRSGDYTLMGLQTELHDPVLTGDVAQAGHRTSYNFTVPVLAVIHFNVTDDLRWNVEAGPYVSFVLDSRLKNKKFVVNGTAESPIFSQKAASVDFGFKLGTGLEILEHYYVGVHYLAGCLDAWKKYDFGDYSKSFGGVTKAWVFSLGYNF